MYTVITGAHITIEAAIKEAETLVNFHIEAIWDQYEVNKKVDGISHQIHAVFGGYICTVFYSLS